MSANNAVTVLRSPSAAAITSARSGVILTPGPIGVEGIGWRVELPLTRALPQSPQKRWPGGLSAPHFGQWCAKGAPQSPQNFLFGGFSLRHLEHLIGTPKRPIEQARLYHSISLLKNQGWSADSSGFELYGHLDMIRDCDEGNAAGHSVAFAVERHRSGDDAGASPSAGDC